MIALLWILVAVNCISFAIFVFSAAAAIRRARRDYFAAKAMSGFMARPGQTEPEYESRLAYKVADAMLAARKTGRTS